MLYTCCWNFNFYFLPLCHQLISLITTIICSLDSVLVSYMDSRYTVQQTRFPLTVNLLCISGLWFCQLLILLSVQEILPTKQCQYLDEFQVKSQGTGWFTKWPFSQKILTVLTAQHGIDGHTVDQCCLSNKL